MTFSFYSSSSSLVLSLSSQQRDQLLLSSIIAASSSFSAAVGLLSTINSVRGGGTEAIATASPLTFANNSNITTNSNSNSNSNSNIGSDSSKNNRSITDTVANFMIASLLRVCARTLNINITLEARTIHAVLVAMNLFWYQALRQTVAILSVLMCVEFNGGSNGGDATTTTTNYKMDTTQQGQLIAAPSVGNILTQALGGSIIQLLQHLQFGGNKTAISIALFGLACGCTFLPSTIPASQLFSSTNTKTNSPLPTTGPPQKLPLQKALLLLTIQGVLFGPMFPAHAVLLSKWIPSHERGAAMAYSEIAISLASMIVPILVTSIANTYSYKQTSRIASNWDSNNNNNNNSEKEDTITHTTQTVTRIIPGWRLGFRITGVVSFGYLVIGWLVFGRNEPKDCSYITKNELDYLTKEIKTTTMTTNKKQQPIVSKKTDATKDSSIAHATTDATEKPATTLSNTTTLQLLCNKAIVTLYAVHMIYNFVTLSINSWMTTYYNDVLHLSPTQSKIHIVVPQLSGLIIKIFVSQIAHKIRQHYQSKHVASSSSSPSSSSSILLYSRRMMGYIGFILTAIPLWFLPMVIPKITSDNSVTNNRISYSPWYTTLLFSVALMGTGFHAESFRANYLDVTKEHIGLISGIGNCLSSVSAMLGPYCVGTIIHRYSSGGSGTRSSGSSVATGWSVVWKLFSIVSVLAAILFGSFSTTTPIEEQLLLDQQQQQQQVNNITALKRRKTI